MTGGIPHFLSHSSFVLFCRFLFYIFFHTERTICSGFLLSDLKSHNSIGALRSPSGLKQ